MAPAPPARRLRAMIRLWRVGLDIQPEAERELARQLSPYELARADAFAMPFLRRRFVAARGTLRLLLGLLTNERPRSVAIEVGPRGKPRIAGGEPRIMFNVSHSAEVALICVTDVGEVGIDVELVRAVPSAIDIARRHFAQPEVDFILGSGRKEFDRRFVLCWVRKEAVVKATGSGLGCDLRSFTTPVGPFGVVSTGASTASASEHWLLVELPLGSDYVGAIALPAHVRREDAGTSASGPHGDTGHLDQCEEIRVSPLLPAPR